MVENFRFLIWSRNHFVKTEVSFPLSRYPYSAPSSALQRGRKLPLDRRDPALLNIAFCFIFCAIVIEINGLLSINHP